MVASPGGSRYISPTLGPAMTMTPVVDSPALRTGAAMELMPGAYTFSMMLKPRLRCSSSIFSRALMLVGAPGP